MTPEQEQALQEMVRSSMKRRMIDPDEEARIRDAMAILAHLVIDMQPEPTEQQLAEMEYQDES